jgi:uncharacterized small protein (DUF1192 family)
VNDIIEALVMRVTQLELDIALLQAEVQALKNWREVQDDEEDATQGRIA